MCKCYPQIHEDAASIKNEQLERNYGNRKKKTDKRYSKKRTDSQRKLIS